jgi:peptidoglycan/LPS O-acetylase OafA/YrhL
MTGKRAKRRRARYLPRLLLLIPLFAVFCVPLYNRLEPTLGGVPFFYWYQLAWVLLGAAIVIALYLIERRRGVAGEALDPFEPGPPGETL